MTVTTEVALDPEKEYEIVAGQPEEKVTGGARHGGIVMRLCARLGIHAEANQLGSVYGPDTTFKIGQNQRLPDIAFVAIDRIPPEGEPEGIWEIPPDLAVEIISPNDLYEKVTSKVLEYFAAGVQQVWLISSEHKTLTVYHSPSRTTILTEADELICDDVIPGFRCPIRELFRNPART